MRLSSLLLLGVAAVVKAGYWMNEIPHLGRSPYHPDPNYKVFRNVKDFGAKGDGGKCLGCVFGEHVRVVVYFVGQGGKSDRLTVGPQWEK
jgi:hypothetical protein